MDPNNQPWDDFDDFTCEDFRFRNDHRLLFEEFDDFAECMGRSTDDGWFYPDHDD